MKIKIMIAGAVKHQPQIIHWMLTTKPNAQITVYDGLDNCAWNAGRINRDITLTDNQLKLYYTMGITIALTFSNPEIDLNDPVGINLLNRFHKEGNSIICVNPKLAHFIKRHFPLYKLIYSITGLSDMPTIPDLVSIERYNFLLETWDTVVPRMEHVFDPEFSKLNQDRFEIMINDTCSWGCPLYKEHFDAIAEQNLIYNPFEALGKKHCKEVEECWLKGFNPDNPDVKAKEKYGELYAMDLDTDQLIKCIKRGNSLKLIGRENTADEMVHELNKITKLLVKIL